jgi:hypothetical protein
MVDDSVGFALGSPETGGVPVGRVEDIRYLSDESRDEGWTYFILPPGTHYLAVQPRRITNLFTYLRRFGSAPRWVIEVPPRTPVIYAGTLDLHGRADKGAVFGNPLFVAFDTTRSSVTDEETLALVLAARHFPELKPVMTILMEPRHP